MVSAINSSDALPLRFVDADLLTDDEVSSLPRERDLCRHPSHLFEADDEFEFDTLGGGMLATDEAWSPVALIAMRLAGVRHFQTMCRIMLQNPNSVSDISR